MKTLFQSLVIFVFVSLFLSTQLFATGEGEHTSNHTTISGKIVDNNTHETLAGVKVILNGSMQAVYTDLDGNFRFENVNPGTYSIACSYISYEDKIVNDIDALSHEEKNIKIELLAD